MTRYAEQTTVSVERSRAEIEAILCRYGADQFGYARDDSRGIASIQFAAKNRQIRFILTLSKRDAKEFTTTPARNHKRSAQAIEAAWEQACRQRWRALALCIKAKLEAVDCGISEFEDEFLANIILPGGSTVSQLMRPQIEQAYLTKKPPNGIAGLLPAPRGVA